MLYYKRRPKELCYTDENLEKIMKAAGERNFSSKRTILSKMNHLKTCTQTTVPCEVHFNSVAVDDGFPKEPGKILKPYPKSDRTSKCDSSFQYWVFQKLVINCKISILIKMFSEGVLHGQAKENSATLPKLFLNTIKFILPNRGRLWMQISRQNNIPLNVTPRRKTGT